MDIHSARPAGRDEYDDALVRNDRIADLELRVEAQQEIEIDQVTRANALRRDRFITIGRKTEDNREMLLDRTKRYDTFVDSLDRLLRVYEDFNRDVRQASVDARMMNYEAVQRKVRTQDRVARARRRAASTTGLRSRKPSGLTTRPTRRGWGSPAPIRHRPTEGQRPL